MMLLVFTGVGGISATVTGGDESDGDTSAGGAGVISSSPQSITVGSVQAGAHTGGAGTFISSKIYITNYTQNLVSPSTS